MSSAIAYSTPGDVIVLDAGTTYSGNFQLPAKINPNNKWIYVQTSAYSSLPSPGTRVAPANSPQMPKIVTPGSTGALGFRDGANHWRFVGIEVRSASSYHPTNYTPGVNFGYALIGDFSMVPVNLPDSITFDRCYIHGDATHDLQEGMQGNFSNVAVVDSYISDIHAKGMDTQAFLAYYTPGPIKLTNNYLEGAGENVMFGGSGGPNNPYVPSDIQVQYNWINKPLAWIPLSLNGSMVVKNLLEVKSGQRMLIDSNTLQNSWAAGQDGVAVVLTVRSSQSGNLAVDNDITITNNVLKNVTGGFVGLAKDYMCGVAPYTSCTNAGSADRWNISNNLVQFYDPTIPGGARNMLLEFSLGKDIPNGGAIGVTRDVVFQHNTAIAAASTPCWDSIYFDAQPNTQASPEQYQQQCLDSGQRTLQRAHGRLGTTRNIGPDGVHGRSQHAAVRPDAALLRQRDVCSALATRCSLFPPHNYATTVPFTYVNPLTRSTYQLLTPYWTDTSDGNIAGVQNANLPSSSPLTPAH